MMEFKVNEWENIIHFLNEKIVQVTFLKLYIWSCRVKNGPTIQKTTGKNTLYTIYFLSCNNTIRKQVNTYAKMDLDIRQRGAKELRSLEGKTYCFITGVCQEARSLNRAEVAENKPHGMVSLNLGGGD